MSLAYVYARLATKTRSRVVPLLTQGKYLRHSVSRPVYFIITQTGLVTAIGITAVSYLSTFFPILNNPVPAGIACIAIVWIFTFVNMLGGTRVSRPDHHWSGAGAYSGSHDRGRRLALV